MSSCSSWSRFWCGGGGSAKKDASKSAEEDLPHEFVCPITQCVMKDPVLLLTSAGASYEKWALEKWLGQNPKRDPYTGKEHKVNLRFLKNRSLKASIDRWRKIKLAQGVASDEDEAVIGKNGKIRRRSTTEPACSCYFYPSSCYCHAGY